MLPHMIAVAPAGVNNFRAELNDGVLDVESVEVKS